MGASKLYLFLIIITLAPRIGLSWVRPEIVALTDNLDEVCLAREKVLYLTDPSADLTLEEAKALLSDGNAFIPSTAQDLINDDVKAAYWLYFEISNHSEKQKAFRIEMFDFDIDEVMLVRTDVPRPNQQIAGFALPFNKRSVQHKNISFDLDINKGETARYLMRFQSRKKNVLEPMIRSYKRIINYGLKEYILFGLFYGLMLLVIFYNLLYFIILKIKHYFLYVVFASSVLLYFLSQNGTGFQYLWNNSPALNPYMGIIGLSMASIFMMWFTASFLEVKKHSPLLYRLLIYGLIGRMLLAIIQLSFPFQSFFGVGDVICAQLCFATGFIIWKQGLFSAKWFVTAFIILNITLLISILEILFIIPSSIITVYSLYAGIVLQFVFLSIAIAEGVKEVFVRENSAQLELIRQFEVNKELNEKVNKELEEKVAARTKELVNAQEELLEQTEEIHQINSALDIANRKLENSFAQVLRETTARGHLSLSDFRLAFPNDLSCKKYIVELKQQHGFVCKKCGTTKTIKGKSRFDRRCASCNYNESLTTNTIFERSKFPLTTGFYMLHYISQTGADHQASSEFCKELEIHPNTFAQFKQKINDRQKALGRSHLDWEELILNPTP